jgi:hypothetical protein
MTGVDVKLPLQIATPTSEAGDKRTMICAIVESTVAEAAF